MANLQDKYDATLCALGDAIYQRRIHKSMSQQELAEQSELHRTYISDIERGARNLTVSTLGRIATALDTTPSRLFKQAEERVLAAPNGKRRGKT